MMTERSDEGTLLAVVCELREHSNNYCYDGAEGTVGVVVWLRSSVQGE